MSKFYFISLLVITVNLNPKVTLATEENRIDRDYYWGSSELRSKKQACDLSVSRLICYLRCGKRFICEGDECKCYEDDKPIKMYVQPSDDGHPYLKNQHKHTKQNPWHIDDLRKSTVQDKKTQKRKNKLANRPALRHHIAHFCPNLDVARTCINTCMNLGKPAFCGKDHVCYCGHRYSSHDDKKKIDINDVYIQYRDIYEKYFGPQDAQSEIVYEANVTQNLDSLISDK